ncbi:MAG: hypothetical protein M3O36_04745 [Myxococcota bacterium]|nr:hypothetical protein [Myxococcota bacterium]
MTRSILAAMAAAVAVAVLSGTGCSSTGVGDPCTPEQEYDRSFVGFDFHEVNVESKSFQCQTRLCLVNHFQGRVSCPYGQQASGMPTAGTVACAPNAGCCTPGTLEPVNGLGPTGQPLNAKTLATVQPQCTDRRAEQTVYCSCRCQNAEGKTDDGANYCTCPDGFTCAQLVTSIGAGDQGLTGGYCIKSGTDYQPLNTCSATCDPAVNKCGNAQGVK